MPEDGKPLDGEEVLLDGNELAAGARVLLARRVHRSARTSSCSPTRPTSPATSGSRCGSRTWRPARSSTTRSPTPTTAAPGRRDGSTLFYVTVDEAWRPYRVWRHIVGTPGRRRRGGVRGEPTRSSGSASGRQPRRALHRDPHLVQADQRGVAARRRRAGRRLRRRRAPAARRRVRRRGRRRPAAHPAQRRRGELRAGGRAAARRPGVRRRRVLDAGDRAPGRHPAAFGGRVRRLPGALLPPRRADRAVGAAGVRRRRGAADHLPRADLHGRPGVEPGVHADPVPARLHLAGHAVHGLRPRPGDRRRSPCSSSSRCCRRRPGSATTRPPTSSTASGRSAADGTRVPISIVCREGHTARRVRALPAVRVRQLRDLDRPQLLDPPAVAARPRVRVRDRAHPRRRRDGPALVRRREDADQEEHVHRLRGVRRAPGRGRLDVRRRGWSPGAAPRAGC